MSLQFIHNVDALRIQDGNTLLCLQGSKTVASLNLFALDGVDLAHVMHDLYMTPDLPVLGYTHERMGDIRLSVFDLRAIETRDEGERVRVMLRGTMDVCIWVNK